MTFYRAFLATLLLSLPAPAAKLVPLNPAPNLPPAFEENRGQARSGALFLARTSAANIAITAQSVIYWPVNVEARFVGSQSAPRVRPFNPLPGAVRSFSGPNPAQWIQQIPRYAGVEIAELYPNLDAQYLLANEKVMLRLICRPGCDPTRVVIEPSQGTLSALPSGDVELSFGGARTLPRDVFPKPSAYQQSPTGQIPKTVAYTVPALNRLGLQIDSYDPTLPLYIDAELAQMPGVTGPQTIASARDAAGNTYVAATVDDAAQAEGPYPELRFPACGVSIDFPVPCTDVAVYKLSPQSELLYVTYLTGRAAEHPIALKLSSSRIMVAGGTDSPDFPVTAGAFQRTFGGPSSNPNFRYHADSDIFALKLDAATGALDSSTYVGGPDGDTLSKVYLGTDESVYLLANPGGPTPSSGTLPVTPGALQPTCPGDPCLGRYLIRLDPALRRAIYATYLPGTTIATDLGLDGSFYFAGWSRAGFPTTPNAFQKTPAGLEDGFVARLNPSGTALIFGTYWGTPQIDWILNLAVAPDGSAWASASSFVQCCVDISHSLIHLDATGSKVLSSTPIDVSAMATDRAGNLVTLSENGGAATPDALMNSRCGRSGGYAVFLSKFDPAGNRLFATYLPYGVAYDTLDLNAAGNPILNGVLENGLAGQLELRLADPPGVYAGCLVSAASLNEPSQVTPGQIVTIFGSGLGPRTPAVAALTQGRLPTTIAGTQILLNGQPIPLLFASYWQVNAIIPYTLRTGTEASLQARVSSVTNIGGALSPALRLTNTLPAQISLFSADGSGTGQAAALNQDGTVNSPQNPAPRGSVVVLYGTGGGATIPPSTAGEITPLELRRLATPLTAQLGNLAPALRVDFAGAAPGLLSGVNQFNIRLPAALPDPAAFPLSAMPLSLQMPNTNVVSQRLTIAIR